MKVNNVNKHIDKIQGTSKDVFKIIGFDTSVGIPFGKIRITGTINLIPQEYGQQIHISPSDNKIPNTKPNMAFPAILAINPSFLAKKKQNGTCQILVMTSNTLANSKVVNS